MQFKCPSSVLCCGIFQERNTLVYSCTKLLFLKLFQMTVTMQLLLPTLYIYILYSHSL